MDIYSGRKAFSIGEAFARKIRRSDSFSRSIAHYTMGIIYDNASRPADAIREYEAAVKTDPGVSYFHTRLAADHFMQKSHDRALEETRRAVSLDPADVRPRFMAALVYTSLGRYEDAQKEYEEAVRLAPDSIWALSWLADIFVLQRKLSEAAAVYEKLIGKDRDSEILYFNLGVIYSRLGRTGDAIKALEQAARVNPKYLEAYIGLGSLHESEKDQAAAIASYEKASAIDPADAGVYHRLGAAYARSGRYDDAVRAYGTLEKISPGDPAVYVGWANTYLVRKLPDPAIEVLQKGLLAGVKDSGLYTMLGYAHSLKDAGSPESLKYYGMALELKPDNAVTRFFMAVYYDKAGDAAAAESQLRQAIKIDPGYADACNYLGYMFAEKGVNLDEAVALVKKALEADPGNGAYIDSLGWAYYRKGDIAGALSELEKAAALEPLDPEIRAHLEEVRSKKR